MPRRTSTVIRDAPPGGAMARLWARQDAHSLYASAAGLLLSLTLVLDLMLHRPGLVVWVLWMLLAVCLGLTATALLMGRTFPQSVGFSCVVVFTAASIYLLSPLGDEQSAVSSAQELPILALYLGWFVRRPLGRILILVVTALLVIVLALNPLFWPDGALGVPTAVQAVVITLLCFEVGSMVWRRSERRITTDQLTGALSRAGFLERLGRELGRGRRRRRPLTLVAIDFDDFKQINDTEGHAAGDTALAETVAAWRAGLRLGDAIGRTGGDEFALLLDRANLLQAEQTVRRLCAESPHSWSWGIAEARAGEDAESVLVRADEALYAAKLGRGR